MQEDLTVFVVGAGPTGLTLGCELVGLGLDVRIIDAADGPARTSRALGIHARTLEIFDQLGVVEPVVDRARPIRSLTLYDRGERVRRVGLQGIESPYPLTLSLPQRETEQILLARLEQLGGSVEYNTRLVELHRRGSGFRGRVRGPEGRLRGVDPRFVVACDGASSTVRSELNIPFEGASIPVWFALADLEIRGDVTTDGPSLFLSDDGLAVLIPMPGPNCYRLVAPLVELPEDVEPTLKARDVHGLIERRCSPSLQSGQPDWISVFRTGRRMVPSMVEESVVFAGDAAHVHSPVGAQGMNSGIQDAHNLAWKLAQFVRGHGSSGLIDSYDDERAGVARAILRSTQLTTHLVAARHWPVQKLRNGLFRLVTRSPRLRSELLNAASQVRHDYESSPVVGQAIGPRCSRAGPRPGQRAPDARWGDSSGQRLHALLREPGFHLWWFAVSGQLVPGELDDLMIWPLVEQAEPFGLTLHVFTRDGVTLGAFDRPIRFHRDVRGEAHRLYNHEAQSLYLIRPDGHIGWRSRPPDFGKLAVHLETYFQPGRRDRRVRPGR